MGSASLKGSQFLTIAANSIVHAPPPVTALDDRPLAGATNVPEPVIVMVEPSLAMAAARLRLIGGPKLTLIMSQRT
jgi:hypothetical protein